MVCKLYTPPISIIGLKPLRLVGIVPAVGLAQGTAPAAAVPAGTVRVEVPGIVPARGIDRAEVPAGTDPVAGIGRLGAGPSCGYS